MAQINPSLANASPEVLVYLSNTSAIPAPEGVTSNFANPESNASIQIKVTSVMLGVMLLFVINRLYVKLILTKKVTWDDGAQRGRLGVHLWNISFFQASSLDLLIPIWLTAVLTPITFLFLKTSFFILYLQIFSQLRWLKIYSWIGLVLTAVTYTVLTICVWVFSTPGKGESWLAQQTSDNEKKALAMSVPQSAIGFVLDLYILVIPVVAVSGLHMSTKRKIGIILVFASGLMACVCSVFSIYYRHQLDHTADVTYAIIPVNIATLCEMFVGIICACMPAAAFAARQENSTYQKLIRSTLYSFTSIKSTIWGSRSKSKFSNSSGSDTRIRRTENYPEPDLLKSTDRKYLHYFNLDEFKGTVGQNTINSVTIHASKDVIGNGPGIQRQLDVDSVLLFRWAKRKNAGTKKLPTAPYWLPGLYHLPELGQGSSAFFSNILKRYGHVAPFLIRAGPIRFLIITDPNHIRKIFQASKEITPKIFHVHVFSTTMGSPREAVALYAAGNKDIEYAHLTLARQYLSGTSLTSISDIYLGAFRRNLTRMNLEPNKWTTIPDLYSFVKLQVSQAIFETLLGSEILEQYPGVVNKYWEFDENLDIYMRGLPRFLAPSVYATRDRLLNDLKNWLHSLEKQSDCSKIGPEDPVWDEKLGSKFFRHRNNLLSFPGMDLDARTSEALAILLAANSNTIPSTFWVVFEALKNLRLQASLSRDIDKFYDPEAKSYDMAKLCAVPLLQSMHAEIGRLRMAIPTARSSETSDFRLDEDYVISKGTRIIVFSHSLAFNTVAWARARPQTIIKPLGEFWAERFLIPEKNVTGNTTENQATKTSSFVPKRFSMEGLGALHITFGGGHHLCPGRHLAKSIQIGTLAILLSEYEMELIDPVMAERMTPPAQPKAFGALMPGGNVPIRIRRRTGSGNK
ncbi:hypothetical protein G7Y89_g1582 [Cudoniella acicularis]|uniref:Rhodopsin domain-containing protein n=1 Tax=Cudoniella acicularis TaxID=354080 RepID=A0A8H4RUZ9_9HELO|nr:hypothetical protein G7Y89_g1582 [Cudoniella acicularis]